MRRCRLREGRWGRGRGRGSFIWLEICIEFFGGMWEALIGRDISGKELVLNFDGALEPHDGLHWCRIRNWMYFKEVVIIILLRRELTLALLCIRRKLNQEFDLVDILRFYIV